MVKKLNKFSFKFKQFYRLFKEPVPDMEGFLKQHMSFWDKKRDRIYSLFAFKFFGTRISIWGFGKLGGLHGKYNWPPSSLRRVV